MKTIPYHSSSSGWSYRDQAADSPAADSPAVGSPDSSAADSHAADSPDSQASHNPDSPAADSPDSPAAENQAADSPADDILAADSPAADIQAADSPAADNPAADNQLTRTDRTFLHPDRPAVQEAEAAVAVDQSNYTAAVGDCCGEAVQVMAVVARRAEAVDSQARARCDSRVLRGPQVGHL